MEQYRSGARINEVMRNVARSLGDEEVAALAAYLEQASRSR
jgi:cytochrome c553